MSQATRQAEKRLREAEAACRAQVAAEEAACPHALALEIARTGGPAPEAVARLRPLAKGRLAALRRAEAACPLPARPLDVVWSVADLPSAHGADRWAV